METIQVEEFRASLVDAITTLCHCRLDYRSTMRVDGLIGVTLDDSYVILVNLNKSNGFTVDKQNLHSPSDVIWEVDNSRLVKTSPGGTPEDWAATRVRAFSAEAQLEGHTDTPFYPQDTTIENLNDTVDGSVFVPYDEDNLIPPGFVKVQVDSDDEPLSNPNNINMETEAVSSFTHSARHEGLQVGKGHGEEKVDVKVDEKYKHYDKGLIVSDGKMFKCKRCGKIFDTFNKIRSHLRAHSNKKSGGSQYKTVLNKAIIQKVKKRSRKKLKRSKQSKSKVQWQHSSNIFHGLSKMRAELENEKLEFSDVKSQWNFDSEHYPQINNAQNVERMTNSVTLSDGQNIPPSVSGQQPAQNKYLYHSAKTIPKVKKAKLVKNKLKNKLTLSKAKRTQTCAVCKKGFPSHASLRGHMKVHGMQSYHQCKSCSLLFVRIDFFKKHMAAHPDHVAGESGKMDADLVKSQMSKQVTKYPRRTSKNQISKDLSSGIRKKRKYKKRIKTTTSKENSVNETDISKVNNVESSKELVLNENNEKTDGDKDSRHVIPPSDPSEEPSQKDHFSDTDDDPLSNLKKKTTSEYLNAQIYNPTAGSSAAEQQTNKVSMLQSSNNYNEKHEMRTGCAVSDPSTVEYTDSNQEHSPPDSRPLDVYSYISDEEEAFSDGYIQGEVLDLSCPKSQSLSDHREGEQEENYDEGGMSPSYTEQEMPASFDSAKLIVPQPQYPRPSGAFFKPEGKLSSLGGAFQPLPGPVWPIDMTFHHPNVIKDGTSDGLSQDGSSGSNSRPADFTNQLSDGDATFHKNNHKSVQGQVKHYGENANISDKVIHKCKVCHREFLSAFHLNNHMTIHTGTKKFRCDQCSRTFALPLHLKRHQKSHDMLYKKSNKGSASAALMKKGKSHKWKSQSKGLWVAKKSTGGITKKDSVHHKKMIGAERKKSVVPCTKCDKTFGSIQLRNQHMYYHTGKKPFKCTLCKGRFMTLNNLKKHLRGHSGALYQCDMCPKQFNLSETLQLHKQKHEGHLSYSCSQCKLTFGNNDDLKLHSQSRHSDDMDPVIGQLEQDAVNESDSQAISPADTDKQRDNSSDKQAQLTPSQHSRMSTAKASKHQKKNSALLGLSKPVCKQCGTDFHDYHALRIHMLKHNNYECNICNRRFLMKAHLAKHRNVHNT